MFLVGETYGSDEKKTLLSETNCILTVDTEAQNIVRFMEVSAL